MSRLVEEHDLKHPDMKESVAGTCSGLQDVDVCLKLRIGYMSTDLPQEENISMRQNGMSHAQ